MNRKLAVLITGVGIACGSAAVAETVGTHKVFLPQDIKWGSMPPYLPAGAEAAVLYGESYHAPARDLGIERRHRTG